MVPTEACDSGGGRSRDVVRPGVEQDGVPAGLGRACREQREQREVVEARRQERDQVQRPLVRPVGVVDDEQEGRGLGERRDQPVERVDELGAGVAARGRCGRLAEDERGAALRGARQQARALAGGGGPQARFEQLSRDAERELALELCAAGVEDGEAGRRRVGERGGEQRGLADAGRPLDDECLP